MSTRRRSWTWALPLVLLAACSSQPAEQGAARTAATASPTGRALAGPASRPVAPIHALVQLTERPTAVAFRGRLVAAATTDGSDATTQATQAAVQQLGFVQAEQAAFADRVAQARVPATNEVYRLQRIYNGIVYATDAAGLARLRALPGARAVHVLTPQELQNAWGVPFVGAKALWSLGVPLHGENITVGVIDTGIDYTHANFGGPGTVAAYDANDKNLVEAGSFPTAKVVGGWDFAGADYDAGSDATSFPMPDADPLDGNGHGSHVSGTVAGLGVTAAGATYAGPYDVTLDPTTLRIGPGAAPAASLVALKVFGDFGGSTSLSALAVEWATDPNGDGDFSDHLDVVNLSLGSSHGSPNDAEAVFYTNAVNAGVVVVTSAGNSSDIYFVTGSPGATPSVISVAASTVGYYPAAVRIDAPAAIAAMVPAGTASFGTAATSPPVTGDVVATVPATACASASAGGVTNGAELVGKIALIARGTCSFALKAKAAADAGAIGVLITNNVAGDPIGMANTVPATVVTVPAFSLTLVDGNAIRAQLAVPAVVTATLSAAFTVQDLARADTIASFSSRGPTRLGNQTMLKPDVAAPGFQVISTAVGSGSEAANFSGTSMASPLTAGVMALLKQSRPTWTPAELKALLMNTAGHDVFNLPTPPKVTVSPARVGAGRIDALAATTASVLAYDKAAPERVSLSFATLDVSAPTTEPRVIAVKNKGTTDVTYDVTVAAAVAPPGVQVTSGSATVTVLAGATADLAVSLVADPAAMVRQRDATVSNAGTTPFGALARSWLSEASGYVVLTPQGTGNGPVLRVPYFAAPTPASAMAAAAPLATTTPAGVSDLTLSGTGVDTRALAVAPQQGVVSLVTPFELGWASPRTPPLDAALPAGYPAAEADIANLRYVGVTSNYTDVGADVASTELYFAVNTWAPWGSPSDVEFDVYVRQAGAPDWEYVLFNLDASRINSINYSDVHFVYLVNLATGSTSGQDYVNGVSQAQIAVPTFMSDTMVLPVFAADLGLLAGSTAIEYQVVAFSNRFGLVDQSPVLKHDLAAPAFATTIDPLLPLGPGFTPFRVDAPAATIPVAYDLDRAKATQVGSLLLVHHTNAAGQRGQVVPVSGLSCAVAADCAATPATPTCDAASGACVGCLVNGDCASGFCDAYGTRTCQSADCRNPAATACPAHYACSLDNGSCQPNQAMLATLVVPANTTCPAGGLQVSTGFDDDHNGALDSYEVVTTNYVCNGLSASITPEPAGANCANGGTKVQVGSGTPSYVCNGATGATGAAGESATVTPEPAGANCPNGGVKVQVGTSAPAYACTGPTGATGANGDSAAVTPEPAGAICTNGGVRVQVGDADPTYVCNGITGATGPTGPTGPVGPVGPKGSSGCSSVGGGSSALSLLGLGLLLWRRRRTVKPAAV